LIQALGLEGAALTLSLLSLLALFTATAYMLTRLGDPAGSPGGSLSGTLAGTLAVAMLPVGYGALAIFHVAEPFATPRPLAAALGLLAVAFALDRRGLAASLAALASLLVHPLMAWPAVVVALWVGLRPRLAAALTLLGALALILAAWAGAPVLGRLFQVMDPEWQAMTSAMAPYLWTATWDASDWNSAAVALLAPLIAAARFYGIGGSQLAHGVSPYVKVALAASLLGASGLLTTILLGDGFDNLLSLQLQPWRALWLSHWLGVAGLGLLFIRSLQTRDPADLISVLGLAGAELLITGAGGLSLIATLAALSLYGRHLSATIDRLLVLMMVAIFALGLVLNLQGLGLGLGMDAALTGLLLQQSAVVILVATGGWLVARFITRPRVRRVALAVGLMLIGALIATGVERSMLLTRDSGQVMVIGRDSSPGSATHSDLDAVTPVGIKITGGFKINGDRNPNTWYVLHGDGLPAGTFGDYKRGIKETWCAKSAENLTEEERAERDRHWKQQQEIREAERRRQHDAASIEAQRILDAAQPATDDHPYLKRKAVKAHPGVLVGAWPQRRANDPLLIPLR
ncbi:MAG TPA: hypothetical protein PLY96_15980, partial [Chromatiaceae bacterium]|nr:hypothetical protein [Chromatiaceae bacterium]